MPDDQAARALLQVSDAAGHDLLCICVQECREVSPLGPLVNHDLLEVAGAWQSSFLRALGESFSALRMEAVAGLAIFLFARRRLESISSITSDACRCSGFLCGGKLNLNKGAACLCCDVSGIGRLGFVGAHFTAGAWSESTEAARCRDFHIAMEELHPSEQGSAQCAKESALDAAAGKALLRASFGNTGPQHAQQADIGNLRSSFDVLIFCGDLNARLRVADASSSEETSSALQLLHRDRVPARLLKLDELASWRQKGAAFACNEGWQEGEVTFAPTYKLSKRGGNCYDEQCLPAWCDRILWCSNPHRLRMLRYDSKAMEHGSDHAPVWATFELLPGRKHVQGILPSQLNVEVRGADGVWCLGSMVGRRPAEGGTFEFQISCPRPEGGVVEVWRNVVDRGRTWRDLEAPIELQVYSKSAGAWCPGMRRKKAELKLPPGQFVACYRSSHGMWSEKLLMERDEGRLWLKMQLK